MQEAVVAKNVANLYREPSTDSEMTTQAIMGQAVRIIEERDAWLLVEAWDSYRAWMKGSWVSEDIPAPSETVEVTSLFSNALSKPSVASEIVTKLVVTATLRLIAIEGEFARVALPAGPDGWVRVQDIAIGRPDSPVLPFQPTTDELVRTAKRFLGVPYLWGGTTPFGMDCSGFTQLVYKMNGINLPRDAHMQADWEEGATVDESDVQPGDLIFFAKSTDSDRITHVGMACGDGLLIQSAGAGTGVTIGPLATEWHARTFRTAQRIVGI